MPAWGFNLFTWLIPVAVLWATSTPAPNLPLLVMFLLMGTVLGVAWLVRLWLWKREKARDEFAWRSWVLAPAAGLVTVALIGAAWLDLSLRARFAVSQGSFESLVAEEDPNPAEWTRVDTPSRLGLYRISEAFRLGDSVVFYEATGSYRGSAGFAHIPEGPTSDLGRLLFAPDFGHLTGDWYDFTDDP